MMRRDGNNWNSHPSVCDAWERSEHTLFLVIVKYHIQYFLGTDIKLFKRFSYLGVPCFVLFSKSFLERIIRKVLRDLRLFASLITRGYAVLFANTLGGAG